MERTVRLKGKLVDVLEIDGFKGFEVLDGNGATLLRVSPEQGEEFTVVLEYDD